MTDFLVIYRGALKSAYSQIGHKGDDPVEAARYVFEQIVALSAHHGDVMYVVPMSEVTVFKVGGQTQLDGGIHG